MSAHPAHPSCPPPTLPDSRATPAAAGSLARARAQLCEQVAPRPRPVTVLGGTPRMHAPPPRSLGTCIPPFPPQKPF